MGCDDYYDWPPERKPSEKKYGTGDRLVDELMDSLKSYGGVFKYDWEAAHAAKAVAAFVDARIAESAKHLATVRLEEK